MGEILGAETAAPDDPRTSSSWRDAWDHAAADAQLARIDARQRLLQLAAEREAAEKRCRQLFGEVVRERTFYQLDRRLSAAIKAALVTFVRALARIGRGTGKTAWMHRRTARDAMERCYGAVPCWIMPTWRVAEQLPAELGQSNWSLSTRRRNRMFVRDIADGDLVGWIDRQFQGADDPTSPNRLARLREALIGPLREVYGVSDKVLTTTLSCILLAAPKRLHLLRDFLPPMPSWLPRPPS